MKLKRNIKRTAMVAGAVTAAGATGYVAYRHRGAIKKHTTKIKTKVKTAAKTQATKAKQVVHKKAENNHTARTAAVKHLRSELAKKNSKKTLRMAPRYRMGRPDVRRRRKAAKQNG